MSRIWSGDAMEAATPIDGWGAFGSVGRGGGGFRSLYADAQGSRAWNVTQPGQPTRPGGAAEPVDPVEQAAQDAFVQGFQEGERLAREAMEQDNAARAELAAALALLAQDGEGALAAMLSQAVIRLVRQIIGEVPIDEATLRERCEAVAACIDGDDDRAVIEVNAEDLPLLRMEDAGIAFAASRDLPRGSVRLATPEGWVEDGPDVRLDRLKALLDAMEGHL